MSQANLAFTGTSGAEFIAYAQNAFLALVSQNSGIAAPTTTYPFMIWGDTTANKLKIRKADNSGWVTLGDLDATDVFVGTLAGAKIAANSVALSKLARGPANKVLLGQGAASDPVWGDAVFDASLLLDGSILPAKLAAGVITGKVAALVNNDRGFPTSNAMHIQLDSGELRGVGYNNNAELAIGHLTNIDAWSQCRINVPMTTGASITKFRRSFYSLWALSSDGKVYSAGYNNVGQLGHGDTTARKVLTRIEFFVTNGLTVTDIFPNDTTGAAGGCFYLCSNGALYFSGYGLDGQGGTGDSANKSVPTLVSGSIANISKVFTFGNNSYLLTTGGLLYATGLNADGSLGLGDSTPRSTFTLVSSLSGVANIVGAYGVVTSARCTVFAHLTNGDVYGCGYNGNGQLGLGDTTPRTGFTKLTTLANVLGISMANNAEVFAWTATTFYGWGANSAGTLGLNNTAQQLSPVSIVGWDEAPAGALPFINKVAQVIGHGGTTGTYGAAVVLDTDGNMWASGRDAEGQLGVGRGVSPTRFTRIPLPAMLSGEKITSLGKCGSDNQATLFALSNQGRGWATGYNAQGQCGTMTVRTTSSNFTLQPMVF